MKSCCEVAAIFGQVCPNCNPVKRVKGPLPKNPCAKTVSRANAYEVWATSRRVIGAGIIPEPDDRVKAAESDPEAWTWYVRKKWQADDDAPYARWFCDVVTPIVPEGESGDVYVADIKRQARRIK